MEGQIMKKRILLILMVFALCAPGFIYAEDAMRGEVMLPTPANVTTEEPQLDNASPTYFIPASTRTQTPPILYPKEWYILEKIPTSKGLAIGVFLFQEGMPIEHIHSVFGKPKEIITIDVEGYDGTILVYPHHHFFFSKTGNLQTIKERKL
jgi:hypothetical protein